MTNTQHPNGNNCLLLDHMPMTSVMKLCACILLTTIGTLSSCVSYEPKGRHEFRCPPTAPRITLTPKHNTVAVSYREPAFQANGTPLRSLSHTTIYYDLGEGAVEYAKQTATSVYGGGEITRDISIPVKAGKTVEARVCITASNSAGEGPPM
jgi:hypothetical protein